MQGNYICYPELPGELEFPTAPAAREICDLSLSDSHLLPRTSSEEAWTLQAARQ